MDIPEGAIPSSRLGTFRSTAETAFRRAVYDREMAWALKHKTFYPPPPDGSLAVVEGKHRMRSDAAATCAALLAKARADLAAAASAPSVSEIAINNAYRDIEVDFGAWQNAFATHYARTQDRRDAADGGPLGDAAAQLLTVEMINYKAVPGFSNHNNGLAVDFQTSENGVTLGPSSAQKPQWRESWLWNWLTANAGDFGFQPLATEEWHWDYKK